MIVNLTLSLTVDYSLLDEYIKEFAEAETVAQGFPVNEDNTAWFIGEMIVADWDFSGIDLEIVP